MHNGYTYTYVYWKADKNPVAVDSKIQRALDLKVSTHFDILLSGFNDFAIDKSQRRRNPVNVEAGQEIEETRSGGDGQVPGIETGKPQVQSVL